MLHAPRSTNVDLSPAWYHAIPIATAIRLAVVAAMLWLVYGSTIRNVLVDRWLNDGNWSHGWLIPLFSLYFLSTRRDELACVKVRPSYVGAMILAASLVLYFVSAWRLRMSYPQALSIVGSIFGLTLLLGGWGVIRITWFPILFLLLAIPIPTSLYVDLTMPLRRLASSAAAVLMPLFSPGLHTEAQAVVIDYVMPGRPPGTLNVEEACSGMRSTMAFVTLGVAIAYLGELRNWQRLVMAVSCIPIAIACNTIRVTITGLLFVHGFEEWARGTAHQLLGVAMFAVALGLFALLRYVLTHLFIEETPAA